MRIFFLFSALVFFSCVNGAQAYDPVSFASWSDGVKQKAIAKGISQQTVDNVLGDLTFIPKTIELDRKQPEGTITFAKYKTRTLSQTRIDKGRKMMVKYADILDKISKQYNVQPQYIIALWGIETSYGGYTGGFDIVNALATLAYEGRRAAFFESELLKALTILDQGHISRPDMKGSWAGAMGQNQFMPSSFMAYAVDFNGDGHKNIWTDYEDAFASTANYLKNAKWKGDERWGRKVTLPANFSKEMISWKLKKPIATWASMGVRNLDGSPLPVVDDMQASIVAPDGINGETYIIYNNYRSLMRWNSSTYFATSVGLLADLIVQ